MALATLSQEFEKSLNLDDYAQNENSTPPIHSQNDAPLTYSEVLEVISSTDSPRQLKTPWVEITEQPRSKKFRYESEPRAAGPITGVNTTPDQKTYPTIKIHNYTGDVCIRVSCVTKDEPYRAHPHRLLGRGTCRNGECTLFTRITEESNHEYRFKNLGVQCVKRTEVAKALLDKQAKNVDPFNIGFEHINNTQSIDLKAVRLCFQVSVLDESGGFNHHLTPVVSDIIYNDKASGELNIVRASHCSGSAKGGTQVILLCEKVTKEDTVVFYLKENNKTVWASTANTIFIHKQTAIVVETPAFKNPRINDHVTVKMQLRREKEKVRSNSIPFQYYPDNPDAAYKKQKIDPILQLYVNSNTTSPLEQQIKREPKERKTPCLLEYEDQWLSPSESYQADLSIPGPSTNTFWQNTSPGPSYVQQTAVKPTAQPLLPIQTVQALPKRIPEITNTTHNEQTFGPILQPINMQPNLHHIQSQSSDIPVDMQLLSTNMLPENPSHCSDMQHRLDVDSLLFTMQQVSSDIQASSNNIPVSVQPKLQNMQELSTNTQTMDSNFHPHASYMDPVLSNIELAPLKMEANSPQNMDQPSPNLQQPHQDHDFSLLMMQSPREQQHTYPEQEDMDTHSSSSLSKFIQDCNDELMITSEEIAEFSSMLNGINNSNGHVLIQI